MKTKSLALMALMSFTANAEVLLPIVKNYDLSSNPSVWNKIKTDTLPESLIQEVSVDKPTNSYSRTFPKSFLNNEQFLVCYKDCSSDSFSGVDKEGMLKFNRFTQWNVVEQATVYYWLNEYFKVLENRFYFNSKHFLKAYTSRDVRDENDSKMRNNAFFLSTDKTLSFLPANKNILFKLLGGKVNRSGFDPSVVIHEAGHFYFDQLFGNAMNSEIGGLNEGFADYLANIVLENAKVGTVMLQGKALRNSDAMTTDKGHLKDYAPGKEVHDLGEGISYILWQTRKMTNQAEEFDRHVVGAVKDISRNPYSTVHDFKMAIIKRSKTLLSNTDQNKVESMWELLYPGKPIIVENMNFLKTVIPSTAVAFDITSDSSQQMSETFGIDPVTKMTIELITSTKISATQTATLINHEGDKMWIVVDNSRKNIIGIYNILGDLVTNEKSLKSLKQSASSILGVDQLVEDFLKKTKAFKDLMSNKGDFAAVLKVTKISESRSTKTFNNTSYESRTIKIDVKKKLISRLFGLPDFSSLEIHTMPKSMTKLNLESIGEDVVIGYKLNLESGISQEMILTKFIQ